MRFHGWCWWWWCAYTMLCNRVYHAHAQAHETTTNRRNITETVLVSFLFLFLFRLIYNISFRKRLCLSKIVGCACMHACAFHVNVIFNMPFIKITISPLSLIFNKFTICGDQQIVDDLKFAFCILHFILCCTIDWILCTNKMEYW